MAALMERMRRIRTRLVAVAAVVVMVAAPSAWSAVGGPMPWAAPDDPSPAVSTRPTAARGAQAAPVAERRIAFDGQILGDADVHALFTSAMSDRFGREVRVTATGEAIDDGRLTRGDGTVEVRDAATGEVLWSGPVRVVRKASADGTRVLGDAAGGYDLVVSAGAPSAPTQRFELSTDDHGDWNARWLTADGDSSAGWRFEPDSGAMHTDLYASAADVVDSAVVDALVSADTGGDATAETGGDSADAAQAGEASEAADADDADAWLPAGDGDEYTYNDEVHSGAFREAVVSRIYRLEAYYGRPIEAEFELDREWRVKLTDGAVGQELKMTGTVVIRPKGGGEELYRGPVTLVENMRDDGGDASIVNAVPDSDAAKMGARHHVAGLERYELQVTVGDPAAPLHRYELRADGDGRWLADWTGGEGTVRGGYVYDAKEGRFLDGAED